MLQSSTLGVVLDLMSLKKSGIERGLLGFLPVTPVEVGEALQDEQEVVDYLQPHQARERRPICMIVGFHHFSSVYFRSNVQTSNISLVSYGTTNYLLDFTVTVYVLG